jgi:uncharacterized protein (TIRG00374 family)
LNGKPNHRALIVGLAVSALIIGVLAYRVDWAEFADALRDLHWPWVVSSTLAFALGMTLRAVRWNRIAGAPWSQAGGYWSAAVVGYVANAIYPGRAGELLRAAALHHLLAVPPGTALASALVDRLADVVVLGAVTLALLFGAASITFESSALQRAAFVLSFVPVLGYLLFTRLGGRLAPWVTRAASVLPPRWAERIPRWYEQAFESTRQFGNLRAVTAALLLTIAAYGFDYLAFWSVLAAFGWALPFHAAVLAAALVALGTLLPAGPGYLGVFQLASVLALAAHGIGESPALAYSIVVQATLLAAVALLGVIAGSIYGSVLRMSRPDGRLP